MVAVVNMEKLFQGLLCCTLCRGSSKRFIFRSLNFTYEMVMIVMFTSAFLNYFNIKVIIVIISAASSLSERATSPSFRQKLNTSSLRLSYSALLALLLWVAGSSGSHWRLCVFNLFLLLLLLLFTNRLVVLLVLSLPHISHKGPLLLLLAKRTLFLGLAVAIVPVGLMVPRLNCKKFKRGNFVRLGNIFN